MSPQALLVSVINTLHVVLCESLVYTFFTDLSATQPPPVTVPIGAREHSIRLEIYAYTPATVSSVSTIR